MGDSVLQRAALGQDWGILRQLGREEVDGFQSVAKYL